MSPIRVALIGLSVSTKPSWASLAHLPYLLSARGKSKYQIVGLLNSSKDASRKAIEAFDLPSDVNAYGSPDELAADPNVDLAVVCVRVEKHYQLTKPLVAAGKSVYVEWPLAPNKTLAKELADLAKANGSKTMVGLQGRASPYVAKIKEILESGTIGKVIGSDFKAFHSHTPNSGLPEAFECFTDRKLGGNNMTVAVAHTIDGIHSILGEYQQSINHANLVRPTVNLLADGKVLRQVQSDVPDEVFVVGSLAESPTVQKGTALSLTYRRNPVPFPDEPAFLWSIFGENGQIRVTMHENTFWHVEGDKGLTIRVHKYGEDAAETIPWQFESWQEDFPLIARNISKLYDLYAEGKAVPTFETAVVRHEQVDGFLDAFQ